MKAQWLQTPQDDDIPSMHRHLLNQATQKHRDCIRQGIELYLGYPLDEEDAALVEIQSNAETDKIIYNGIHIGTVTGEWVTTGHLMKYVWTFRLTP